MQAYFWLLICVVLIAVELATMGLTTIWFAAGALGAYVTAILGGSFFLQLLVLIAVSLILLYFTRPIVMKLLKAKVNTNADALIGETAIVQAKIDNLLGQGEVKANGLIWSARSTDDSIQFNIGDFVEIVKIQGNKLIVKKMKDI